MSYSKNELFGRHIDQSNRITITFDMTLDIKWNYFSIKVE